MAEMEVKVMKRDEQVKLLEAAEVRTTGYLRTWMKDPKFKAAVHRQDRPKKDGDKDHYEVRVRKHACA
jgi:hypothetical protein